MYIVIFRNSKTGKKQAVMYHQFYVVFDELFKANFWAQRNGGSIRKHRGEGPFILIDDILNRVWLKGTEWKDAEVFWKDARAGFPMAIEEQKAIMRKIQEEKRIKEGG